MKLQELLDKEIDAMMERIWKARAIYDLYMLGLSIEAAIEQININN